MVASRSALLVDNHFVRRHRQQQRPSTLSYNTLSFLPSRRSLTQAQPLLLYNQAAN